jgi:hypothetical protein
MFKSGIREGLAFHWSAQTRLRFRKRRNVAAFQRLLAGLTGYARILV